MDLQGVEKVALCMYVILIYNLIRDFEIYR